MNPKKLLLLTAGLLLAATWTASAQSGGPYSLRWHTIDGGGGRCAGGPFALHGTIGQPESGVFMSSYLVSLTAKPSFTPDDPLDETIFTLQDGFWAGVVAAPSQPPKLNIALDSLNHVTLTWPYPSPGYVLQQNTNLSLLSGWVNYPTAPALVGTNWQVGHRAGAPALLFRLRKP